MKAAIEVRRLSKSFGKRMPALDDVSLTIGQGEMVALIGPSGSGKSTLLRHLSGLALGAGNSTPGHIRVLDRDVQQGGRLAGDIRGTRCAVGFIFQQFNLVGRLPVLTNVLAGRLGTMPLWRSLPKVFTKEERRDALAALARVGIPECATQRASTLSGGQQQRAAIARALVQKARIILADEPIASLDPRSAQTVMDTLAEINRRDGITVVVSLHQVDYARRYCRRTVALRGGRIVFDGPSTRLSPALLEDIYGTEVNEVTGASDETGAPPADNVVLATGFGARRREAASEARI